MRTLLVLLVVLGACAPDVESVPPNLARYRDQTAMLQQEAASLGRPVRVTVTFNAPLDAASAVAILERSGASPMVTYVYMRHPDGTVGTLGTQSKFEGLAEEIESIRSVEGVDLIGIGAAAIDLPAANIDALAADRNVFLVDPSGDDAFSPNPENRLHVHGKAWPLFVARGFISHDLQP